MKVQEAAMKTCLFTLEVDVHAAAMPEFIDITKRVEEFIQQSQVRNGFGPRAARGSH